MVSPIASQSDAGQLLKNFQAENPTVSDLFVQINRQHLRLLKGGAGIKKLLDEKEKLLRAGLSPRSRLRSLFAKAILKADQAISVYEKLESFYQERVLVEQEDVSMALESVIDVSLNMDTVRGATDDTVRAAGGVASEAQTMSTQAEDLVGFVRVFKVEKDAPKEAEGLVPVDDDLQG
ncbi:MAG: hypothetical protein CSA35_02175 [Dethiosulfovibrio peptidovorans]|nr:MAG: hypothetical protein CSA35_02175 [Dethiosulfovibrio peptidovorans]